MEFLLNETKVSPRQHKNIHYTEWPTKKYPKYSVNVINIFINIKITTNVTLQLLSYFAVLADCYCLDIPAACRTNVNK
jgi:hypothetical protein